MNAPVNPPKLHDCRDAFASTLERLAGENETIVAVCNDSVGSSKLGGFKSRFPERLVNVGIAEQNMVGVGAGLANGGRLPFVCGAAPFLTGRSLEQIKADISYSNANVKLVGISSGMAYGELGPTHHSIEDFAWTRVLPNLPVIAPCDRIETAAAVAWAATYSGPCFLRLSRVGVPDLLAEGHTFELGKANLLRQGSQVTLIANGTLTHRIVKAAEILADRASMPGCSISQRFVRSMKRPSSPQPGKLERSSRPKSIRSLAGSAPRWPKWWSTMPRCR